MAGAPKPPPDSHPILLLRPMHLFIEQPLSAKYLFLKPWEAEEDLSAFLAAHANSIRLILCTGSTPVDAATIARLPRLECVVTTSAGVDMVDIEECRRRGVSVANAGNAFSEDTADYAVGLIIGVLRRVSAADRYVREGMWSKKGDYPLASKLSSKRIGIIGLGRIGSEIAKRLEAFGCIISYNSRRTKTSVPYTYFSNLRELATSSDVLVVCCALNNETKHIVNKDVLSALGKKGIVINVGRGALVDEKELVRCLMEGEIGGAGLDVFENEPSVPQVLFNMDNVVLSPHNAVMTSESLDGILQQVTGNLEAFFSNKPLLSPVL